MAIFRSELLKQRDRFRIGLDALSRAIGHVGDRHAASADRIHAGAFGDEIKDHGVIASGGGVVKRRESTIVPTRRRLLLLLCAGRCRS